MEKGESRPDLYRARIGTCPICSLDFRAVKDFKSRKQKYCSKECWSVRGKYRRLECVGCGKVGLNKFGKKYCSRACAFKYKVDEKAPSWQGDNAGYSAIHKFIISRHGKPKVCISCNTIGKRMNWANISRKYSRDRSDWLELCAKCHKHFDTRNTQDRKLLIEKYTGNKKVIRNGEEIDWEETQAQEQTATPQADH